MSIMIFSLVSNSSNHPLLFNMWKRSLCDYTLLLKKVNWSMYIKKKKKCWSGQVNSAPIFFYNNPHNIQCCFELMCFTYWIVFHFEPISIGERCWFKMNHYFVAWRYMAWWNWSTTILSHHGWCTWTTIINGQGIRAEKISYLFVSFGS